MCMGEPKTKSKRQKAAKTYSAWVYVCWNLSLILSLAFSFSLLFFHFITLLFFALPFDERSVENLVISNKVEHLPVRMLIVHTLMSP